MKIAGTAVRKNWKCRVLLRGEFACQSRSWSEQKRSIGLSERPLRHAAGKPPSSAAFYITNPSKADHEKLVSLLPKSSRRFDDDATLLATPQLAHWLDDSHPFLSLAVDRIWGAASARHPQLKLNYGIVDAIPDARELSPEYTSSTQELPASTYGHEGICLHFSRRKGWRPDHASPQDNDKGLIRFSSDPSDVNSGLALTSIALPAANTLFANGRPFTLMESTWARANSGLTSCTSSVEVSTLDIHVRRRKFHFLDLNLPLFRLTAIRYIISSMGNIIRELQSSPFDEMRDPHGGPAKRDQPFPASQELEHAVNSVVTARKAKGFDKSLQVYAVVIPAGAGARVLHESPEQLDIRSALWEYGATLHRVTSGGGGWGTKQGLLSLDPAVDFAGPSPLTDVSTLDQSKGSDGRPAHDNIFASGNFIMFYGGPILASPEVRLQPKQLHKARRRGDAKGHYKIGVIPPLDSTQPETPSEDTSSKIFVQPNFFGMLSEQGACIEGWQRTDEDGATDTPTLSRSHTTRLDVPFATFDAFKGMRPREKNDVTGSTKENPASGLPEGQAAAGSDVFRKVKSDYLVRRG